MRDGTKLGVDIDRLKQYRAVLPTGGDPIQVPDLKIGPQPLETGYRWEQGTAPCCSMCGMGTKCCAHLNDPVKQF